VWRVGPAAVEERAVEGVGLAGGEDAAPVIGMNRGLRRGEEARAHPGARRAEGEYGREASSVRDSARRDDRDR